MMDRGYQHNSKDKLQSEINEVWGGGLIVFIGPGVGHLTDLVLPGEGVFESFFA